MFRRFLLATSVAVVFAASGVSEAHAAAPPLATPRSTWMVNGPVRAIAEVGDTIWLGGSFTQLRERPVGVGGGQVISVENLAAISATTGRPVPGLSMPAVGGFSGAIVYALQTVGTQLYVGGNFTSVGGQSVSNLVVVNGLTGQLTGFRPKIGQVLALGRDATKLYAGGSFSSVDGKARKRLAAFSLADGTLDPDWRPQVDRRPRDISVTPDDTSVFVVGEFTNAAGPDGTMHARDSMAKFSSTDGALAPWVSGCPCSTDIYGIGVEATDSVVYVGVGGSDWVAAYNASTGALHWRTDTSGQVQDVGLMGDRLIVAGHFGYVAPEPGPANCYSFPDQCRPRSKLAAVDLNGFLDQAWDPEMHGPYAGVWRVLVTPTALWAGGAFVGVGSTAQSRIAAFPIL